jgi:hypothetical protein
MAKVKTYIGRHILEVRLEKRIFNFLDFKGELIDFLLEKTDFPKVSINTDGVRIEIASETLDQKYFVSFQNFGFQIDAQSGFDNFKVSTSNLISMLIKYKKYKTNKIARLGTKSSIFCNIRSRSESEIRQLFFDKLFANKNIFEEKTKLKVDDLGFFFLDNNYNEYKTHLTVGPGNLDEFIQKYIGKIDLYKDFKSKSGIIIDLDVYSENLGKLNYDKIVEKSNSQIDTIEEIFNNFIKFFDEKAK